MDEEADFLYPSPQQPLLYHQTSSSYSARHGQGVDLSRPAQQESLSQVHHSSGSVQSTQTVAERDQLEDVRFELWSGTDVKLSSLSVIVALTILTVIAQTGKSVSLVLSSSSLNNVYFTSLFVTLWSIAILVVSIGLARLLNSAFPLGCTVRQQDRILIGFLNAVSWLVMAYSALPSRLPLFLNQLLSSALIPLAALARFVFIRKPLSCAAFTSAACVLVGLIVSTEPLDFSMDKGGAFPGLPHYYHTGHESTKWKSVWSVLFTLGLCAMALLLVTEERAMKTTRTAGVRERRKEVNTLVFLLWIELWTLVFLAIFFFSDVIPGFGQADSIDQFGRQMRQKFECLFGQSESVDNCHLIMVHTWILVLFSMSFNLLSLMLIKYADGALYLAITQSLAVPLSAIFWTLFQLNTISHLNWHPVFETATIFVLVGFAITLPGLVLYNFFWRRAMAAMQH